MQIIEPGAENVYRIKCPYCGAEMTYIEKDVMKFQVSYLNYPHINCPCCNSIIRVDTPLEWQPKDILSKISNWVRSL